MVTFSDEQIEAMEENRTIFNIPAENFSKFEEQIAKLSRKAVKLLGPDMAFKPFVFSHEERELEDGQLHRVYEVLLTAVVPKINGWTFVARLDHSNETGTIIRMVPNAGNLPEQYRHASSTSCDHCGHKRYRRDTFVVRCDETGEYKQVGSTCLKDFFGQDPFKLAKMAELLSYAAECGRGYEHFVGGDLRWISVDTYLANVAAVVRKKGWVSGKAAFENANLTATRSVAYDNMIHSNTASVTEADHKLAEEAVEWAASLREKAELNDYEHNITVVAEASMIEFRSMGLAASIVGVFYTNKMKALCGDRKVSVGNFDGVIDLMQTAAKHLKFPKIRLRLEDGQPIVLSLAGQRSSNAGNINITDGGPFGDNVWFGRVTPTGEWVKSKSVHGGTMTSLTALLTALAVDPAATAAKYGKLTGQCCFCSLPLKDARSTAVGYGKTCAGNYGLPWGEK